MTEKEDLDNDCTNCPAFKICPEKPAREDYADENEYLIDLECGVWSCQKTIEKLCKENEKNIKLFKELKEHCDELELINQKVMEENEQIKEYNTDLKESLDWSCRREIKLFSRVEKLKTDLEYATAIIKDLLNNSHEYAKQNAENFIKGENVEDFIKGEKK